MYKSRGENAFKKPRKTWHRKGAHPSFFTTNTPVFIRRSSTKAIRKDFKIQCDKCVSHGPHNSHNSHNSQDQNIKWIKMGKIYIP